MELSVPQSIYLDSYLMAKEQRIKIHVMIDRMMGWWYDVLGYHGQRCYRSVDIHRDAYVVNELLLGVFTVNIWYRMGDITGLIYSLSEIVERNEQV